MRSSVKIVRPPNKLKSKVGFGGFDQNAIVKAQQVIEENDIDFAPIAKRIIDKLRRTVEEAKAESSKDRIYHAVQDYLMQLRAQGAMFGYPSITAITDILVDFLDTFKEIDHTILEIISAYERAAEVLISSGIDTATDPLCKAVSVELMTVCQKYAARHKKG